MGLSMQALNKIKPHKKTVLNPKNRLNFSKKILYQLKKKKILNQNIK